MGDTALSELSTELENAGLVGGAAASILGIIAFGDSAPGFLTTTPTSAVWTKSVSNAAKHSANLGIAKLTFEGGSLNANAAFAFDDEGLTDFNLLIELAGANAATMLTLEFDTAHAYLAPAKKQGTTIVGYTDPQQPKPAKLPLPVAAAIEFSITRSGDDILSAVTLHGSPAGPAAIAQGIYRFDLGNDVLVLPKLGKVGISLKDLFVDFSSTAATPVSDLFTEVYAPSWTGVGAKAIGIHFPIDKKADEWVNATLDGFLLGFDGKASLKGKLGYSNNDNAKLIKSVSGEIDIRNNEVVRGALELELNLDKAVASVSDTADGSSTQDLTSSQKKLVTTSRTFKATATSQSASPFAGDLKCRAQIIRIPLCSDDDIIGFDISVEAVETPGQPAGLVLTGTAARALFWAGLGGGAAALLITGAKDDDALKIAGGIGLTFLLICDLGDFIAGNSPKLLPTLERFELRKLGYRFVTMPAEGATPAKSVHQFSLDAVISMTFDGTLFGLISAIGGRIIDTAQEFGKLFAKSASEIEIKGPLDLEISNMAFGWETTDTGSEFVSTVDERVRRVAGQKDLQIKPRKVPTIGLKSSPGSSTSSIPKPIVKVDFVTKETNGETQYGVSLRISGLENPDFKLESPFVLGIVAYFSPEFRLEFEASLIVEPRFRFVIPYWVLVDGAFELNKEIPGFDGVQNRISVDVGVINNKVAKGSDIGKDNLRLLNDISNYNYQFGGEVAWGEAFKTDPVKRLEFLFVEAHYEGASPIFVIGPVGIYGLGGLFGKNIAPGMSGDTRDASSIAQWIEGNGDGFKNVLDWPASPSQTTWHPAKDFVEDEPLIVAGLKVRAGPVGSRTVDVDGLLMLGFDEFWIAAAGNVKVKAINLNATTIVVYDDPSRSFTLRIRFDFALKSGNDEILGIAGPIEISSGSGAFRIALGHFLPERGGPLVARLFKDLFRAQFYAAYDSERQDAFGFALPGMDDRPDLGKKAYSQGAMYQYGPKRIGPSAVNIRVHAAAGYNFGLSGDPFMIVGELFLSGSLRVKVLFIKIGFTLTAYLAGRLTSERFDFRGKLSLEIGMPWPIPDVEVSVSLGFTIGGDKPAIPSVSLEATVHALTHSEPTAEEFPEPKAEELPESGIPILPIDAVIGLKFNRPIVAIFEGASTATALPDIDPINQIDPAQPQNSPFVETVKTTLDGKDYTIEYEHYLSNVRVSHRPVGGGAEVVVPSMFASWEVPAAYDDGTWAPDASDKPHHAIYLNSLLQPGLDFAPEKLGKFIRGQIVNGVIPPCRKPERVCLIAGKAPGISEDATTGLRVAWRASPYGSISVRETAMPQPPSPITLNNRARLGWTAGALSLPGEARIEVPPAGRVSAEIELHTIASRLAGTVLVTLDVEIAGAEAPARLVMAIDIDPSVPCALGLKTEVLSSASAQVGLDAKVKACARRGVIVLGLEVAVRKPGVRLRRMTLRGPRLIPPGTGRDAGNDVPDPDRWLKLVGELGEGPTLFLNELCFETLEATHGAWQTVTQKYGSGPATDASIEQFVGSLLLEPNREYTVKYRVQSYGRSAIATSSGGSIGDEATFDTDSTLTGGLRTVRFQTEAEPSQTISRYVGFTYPAPQMAPVYPDQTVPLVSYRNNGLIKRIYEIHKGAGALKSKIRDLDGKELATAATGTLSVSSGAAGEVMEGLIGTCLEAARGFTRIEVDMFERALKTDTRYGLSVEDTTVTPGANDLPPYRSAFRTSRYQSFAAHVAAVNALLADPVQVPLIDDSPSQLLAPVFADVASGNLAGYDDLVEAIFRRTLAHETGRLADEFGRTGDVAAQLVAQLSDGSLASFGMALELDEPLIGKEGVGFGGMELPLPAALEDKGITQHQMGTTRLVSVRDRSGSRLIVFRTSDVTIFEAMLAPVQMPVTFDGTKAVRIAVQDYVDKTYAALDENDRKKEFDAAMTKLAALPEMAGGLVETTGILSFEPVGGASR